jgi:hypothetical protein
MRAAVKALIVIVACTPALSFAGWTYHDATDEMRGEKSSSASILSNSSITQEPPYSAPANLEITAIRSARGDALTLRITEGQLSCSARLCDVSMKFDSGKIIELKAVRTGDSTDTISVQGPNLFVATSHIAEHLIVEVPVFRYGKAQFKFDIAGLEWDGQLPRTTGLFEGVGNVKWLDSIQQAGTLELSKNSEGDDQCYVDGHPPKVLGVTPDKLTHCFYRGRHYSSLVSYSNRKTKELGKAVSKEVGKPDFEIDGFVSWSELREKNVVSTSIIGSPKGKDSVLLVNYAPLDNLVPERTPIPKEK